jgi:uncharacterized protein
VNTVRDNPTESRYEVYDGDQLAGFSEYQLIGSLISFTHTEIGDAFSGRGLARQLVGDQLADARRRGLSVLPFCPYVRHVIERNPDKYLDLVPAKDHEQFQLPADESRPQSQEMNP